MKDTRDTRDTRSASHNYVHTRILPDTRISIEISHDKPEDVYGDDETIGQDEDSQILETPSSDKNENDDNDELNLSSKSDEAIHKG